LVASDEGGAPAAAWPAALAGADVAAFQPYTLEGRSIMRIKAIALVLSSALLGSLAVGRVAAETPAPGAPIAGKIPLGVTVAEADLIETGWRVSKLLRAEVRNDKGEKIGSIDDIIVSTDGTLSTAIVEIGGFLGLGGHKVAVPVRQLVLSKNPTKILLPGASKEALRKVPEFIYTS
jgi:sporulation protein YlmC with PRC-barrel domain